jgi:hypothetical protein
MPPLHRADRVGSGAHLPPPEAHEAWWPKVAQWAEPGANVEQPPGAAIQLTTELRRITLPARTARQRTPWGIGHRDREMKRMLLGLLVAAVTGCGATPEADAPSSQAPPVMHGLKEIEPYFGQLREAESPDQEVGEFMLALCGCDCWRVMMLRDDGTVRTQILVEFSPLAGSQSPDEVVMRGEVDGAILTGTVDQEIGSAEGHALIGPYAMRFAARRSEDEADEVRTCVACHVGAEPIQPLPAQHPGFQLDPPNCLTCHSLEK